MSGPDAVARARAEADRARDRLMASAQALQLRLSPKVLARDAWEGTKAKGADLVEDAVDAVRARPLAATGVVTAIALFLAREPLIGLASDLVDGVSGRKEAKRSAKRSTDQQTVENSDNGPDQRSAKRAAGRRAKPKRAPAGD